MELKELRREMDAQPKIEETIHKFQDNWLRPLHLSSNRKFSFINHLPQSFKKELKPQLQDFYETLCRVKRGKELQQKLRHYAHHLVELKLAIYREDNGKAKMITNRLLNDPIMGIRQTMTEMKDFSENTKKLSLKYHTIHSFLHRHLSLDEYLTLMDIPHKTQMNKIIKAAGVQKKHLNYLAEHFIKLAKEAHGGRK